MMKKSIVTLMIVFVTLMAFAVKSNATTKDELKAYVLSDKTIAGSTFSTTDADRVKIEKFFKTHEISDEDATNIKKAIQNSITIMNRENAKNPSELSPEARKEIYKIITDAISPLGFSITYDAATGRIEVYENGVLYDSLEWGEEEESGKGTTEPAFKQTGATNYVYIIAAGVVVIAGITIAVVRKKANA